MNIAVSNERILATLQSQLNHLSSLRQQAHNTSDQINQMMAVVAGLMVDIKATNNDNDDKVVQ